jgi:uncharacterized protein (DUF1697 family)
LASIGENPSRLLIAFLAEANNHERLRPLAEQDWTPEVLALGTRVVYLWCPRGILESRASRAVSAVLGDGVTTRNWATVLKLHAMAGG